MEALKVSEDVIKAKSARKNAKGSLTRVANQLRKQLVLEPGEKYNFLQLDKFSIEEDAKKLQIKLSALQECNEAYSKIGLETLYKLMISSFNLKTKLTLIGLMLGKRLQRF